MAVLRLLAVITTISGDLFMRNDKKRRISSVLRDNWVHDVYKEELDRLGEIGAYVAKEYLYNKVMERTGLSVRTISYILNHTVKREID